jgi:hypothetical protein
VAQAAHWLDLTAFYAEARRVLRPGGVIAMWCYRCVESDSPILDDCIHEFQQGRVEPYWPPGRELVEAKYETLAFPFDRIAAPQFEMSVVWNRDALMGFVSSWSAVVRCREIEGVDPMPEFAAEIAALWPDGEEERDFRWPIYLLAGRV